MPMPKSFVPDMKPMPASFVPDTYEGIHLGEVFHAGLWYEVARKNKQVVIPDDDRRFEHCYMRAASGGGKTNTLMTIISQDIQNPNKGVIVYGPKKDIFEGLLPYIPRNRQDDLVYFNPMDATPPIIGFNPFVFDDKFPTSEERDKALLYKGGELANVLERAVGDLGNTMKNVVSMIARALIRLPSPTINDIRRLLDLGDNGLRLHVAHLKGIPDDLLQFWTRYDQNKAYRMVNDNVFNRFVEMAQPPIATVLGVNSIKWHELVQRPKIIFIDLSELPKGHTMKTIAQLTIASMQTAFRRMEQMPKDQRVPYYIFFDEFGDFMAADESLSEMFSQARGLKVSLTVAHQSTSQIPNSLLNVIQENVATRIILRIADYRDAGELAKNMQLYGWEHEHGDLEQIMQREEKNVEELAAKWGYNAWRGPAEKKDHLEEVRQIHIKMAKGSIDHTTLMNLNPREGHSIVLLPSENYGIPCKIPLFKLKGGDSGRYAAWLIQNSKQVYGAQTPQSIGRSSTHDAPVESAREEEEDDYLS